MSLGTFFGAGDCGAFRSHPIQVSLPAGRGSSSASRRASVASPDRTSGPLAQRAGAFAGAADHGFEHERRRQKHAPAPEFLDEDAGQLPGPQDGLRGRRKERDRRVRGRAVERRVAARERRFGQVGPARGIAARVVVEQAGVDPKLAGRVGEHGIGRRLAGVERAAGMTEVEEDQRVAEAVGVTALGCDLLEIVGGQRIVAGDLALVGRRHEVARPQLIAQQSPPRHRVVSVMAGSLCQVAMVVRDQPQAERGTALCSLHHVIDLDWMREAYRLTRKDGAPGIDGVTAEDYEANLEVNLLDLLERIKSGRYRAPPVRRAYIPKADGSQRMLGIPTFEDKVAQRAVTMVLEAVYEQDFLPCSYGFRPGRSAHQALRTLQNVLWAKRLYWVIDIDIRKYFDSIPHSHLRTFLDQRVTDGVIRRMIDKWLKAGAVEDGLLHRTTEGSPQGGVISPCLSNVFLHYVLDEWFETEVRPRLKGESTLARFADDAIMAFDNIVDAKRVLAVLGKRLARFGLTLHPDKTRLVDFRPQMTEGARHPETDGTSFDFLGLTHVWGRSRNGKNMVRQVTAKSRFARALATVSGAGTTGICRYAPSIATCLRLCGATSPI